MDLFGASNGWGGGRGGKKTPTTQNLLHIFHNYETWHSCALHKEDPKNVYIIHLTHPFSSADVDNFSQ